MNSFQIEKKHSELIGLSYESQLRILKSAKQEAFLSKNKFIRLSKIIIICIAMSMVYGFVARLIPITRGVVGIFVLGAICGAIGGLYYKKVFQQKIRELVQAERCHQ